MWELFRIGDGSNTQVFTVWVNSGAMRWVAFIALCFVLAHSQRGR